MLFPTPPLTIIDAPTENILGWNNRKQIIVVHATAGTDSLGWMQNNPLGTSAHRLINKKGAIYKLAPDDAVLGHVGFSQVGSDYDLNNRALGLEIENRNDGRDPYPADQLESAAWQVVEWWGAYGFLTLVTHAMVDTKGKTDPRNFPRAQFDALIRDALREVLR